MKSLSQSEYGELRDLYSSVYETVDFSEELLDETFDELVDELIEEGYGEEEAIDMVDEATDLYIDSVLCEVSDSYYDSAVRASKKAAQGIDKAARRKRRAGQVRYAQRKAGEVFKRGKELAGAAKAGASLAKDFAGDELRRAGRKAVHSAKKTANTVMSAPGKAKDKAKKGIKGFIKRQAEKVVKRMSEEVEALKATGKFSEKEIEAIMEAEMREGYDEPKMHSAVKRVMTTQPAAKGRAASRLHSKYSMRSKGNVAGETDGPGPNAPKRSGRKGRGSETDRGSGNAAKRRMEG